MGMVSFNVAASALTLMATFAGAQGARQLSSEPMGGYEPKCQVTDQNALDLDQESLVLQLALSNDDAFAAANKIYGEGGFSGSYAIVTLTTPLPSSVSAGTVVMGLAADGNQVAGEVLETTSAGATVLQVRYQTTDSQKNYVNCQVGAATVPNTEGCYAPTGTLDVGGTEIAYSYDPLTANKNTRTLKGLSTELQASMKSTTTVCTTTVTNGSTTDSRHATPSSGTSTTICRFTPTMDGDKSSRRVPPTSSSGCGSFAKWKKLSPSVILAPASTTMLSARGTAPLPSTPEHSKEPMVPDRASSPTHWLTSDAETSRPVVIWPTAPPEDPGST